jgi:AraC family transcriptional regulator, regulatory protein of adaptative response / methylphosphotriester-DNA alkyltransferase methyltransferase
MQLLSVARYNSIKSQNRSPFSSFSKTPNHPLSLQLMNTITTSTSARQREIVNTYLKELDKHIAELKQGLTGKALEIADFAAKLHIHPVHLSNTIKAVTGQSTCSLYEERLLNTAKELLTETNMPIGQVAMQLTYDPSNFTKFFKTYTGITPKQFRQQQA